MSRVGRDAVLGAARPGAEEAARAVGAAHPEPSAAHRALFDVRAAGLEGVGEADERALVHGFGRVIEMVCGSEPGDQSVRATEEDLAALRGAMARGEVKQEDGEWLLSRVDAQGRWMGLEKGHRAVVEDITRRMGLGMARYAARDMREGTGHRSDYNAYCHWVAGLVGEGLSRMFGAPAELQRGQGQGQGQGQEAVAGAAGDRSQPEDPRLQEMAALSNHMGLFLQKTNIIRDYLEDQRDGRAFWPRDVWAVFSPTARLGYFDTEMGRQWDERAGLSGPDREAAGRERLSRGLRLLDAMVADALQHAPHCIHYLRLLRDPHVGSFCAIPQVMAAYTLRAVAREPRVFQGVVKMRKTKTLQLLEACSTPLSHRGPPPHGGLPDATVLAARALVQAVRDISQAMERPLPPCGPLPEGARALAEKEAARAALEAAEGLQRGGLVAPGEQAAARDAAALQACARAAAAGGEQLSARQERLGGAAGAPREAAAVAAARCAEELQAMEAEDAGLRADAWSKAGMGVGVSGSLVDGGWAVGAAGSRGAEEGSLVWAVLSSWQALAVALVVALATVRWLLHRRDSWAGWAPRLTDSWDVAALCLLVVCGLYLMGFSYVPVLRGLGVGLGPRRSQAVGAQGPVARAGGKLAADLEAMRWTDAVPPQGVPPLPPGAVDGMVRWAVADEEVGEEEQGVEEVVEGAGVRWRGGRGQEQQAHAL